jgi:hypothetical protein
MKKIYSLILCAVIGVGFANAQSNYKPQAKSFAVELQFMPFGLADVSIMTVNNGNAFGISPRYYINERLELRADILFGMNGRNRNDSIYDYGDEYGSVGINKIRESATSFGVNLGVNYHFKGTERISPYIGGFVGAGFSKDLYKQTVTYFENADFDGYEKMSRGEWYFNVCAVTGFNWYITDGLYIGAELGLGFGLLRDMNTVRIAASSPDAEPTFEETIKPTSFDYAVSFIANPAIRLGWRF